MIAALTGSPEEDRLAVRDGAGCHAGVEWESSRGGWPLYRYGLRWAYRVSVNEDVVGATIDVDGCDVGAFFG